MAKTSMNKMGVTKKTVAKVQPAAPMPVSQNQPTPVAPVQALKPDYFKRTLYIMIPVTIIAFLIISISLTFGQTQAGEAMGVLEGCLILVVGLLVVFFAPIKSFFKATFGKWMPSKKRKETVSKG